VSYSLHSTEAVITWQRRLCGHQCTAHLVTTLVLLQSLGSENALFTWPYVISRAAAATVHTMNALRCSGRWTESSGNEFDFQNQRRHCVLDVDTMGEEGISDNNRHEHHPQHTILIASTAAVW